jgi:hypothetical protein
MNLSTIKVGDIVTCKGDSSFCQSSKEKVIKITIQYDKHTGIPYNVIHLSGNRKFDSRSGSAITPPLAYYVCL